MWGNLGQHISVFPFSIPHLTHAHAHSTSFEDRRVRSVPLRCLPCSSRERRGPASAWLGAFPLVNAFRIKQKFPGVSELVRLLAFPRRFCGSDLQCRLVLTACASPPPHTQRVNCCHGTIFASRQNLLKSKIQTDRQCVHLRMSTCCSWPFWGTWQPQQ